MQEAPYVVEVSEGRRVVQIPPLQGPNYIFGATLTFSHGPLVCAVTPGSVAAGAVEPGDRLLELRYSGGVIPMVYGMQVRSFGEWCGCRGQGFQLYVENATPNTRKKAAALLERGSETDAYHVAALQAEEDLEQELRQARERLEREQASPAAEAVAVGEAEEMQEDRGPAAASASGPPAQGAGPGLPAVDHEMVRQEW